MPFLGSQPAEQYKSLAKQTITGDGSTAYTLNRSVTNAYDMEVFINNVRQEPDTSYTASGNTITFTAAVTASDSCYIIFQGQAVGSINPPTNSVGGAQIQNTSITHNHLHTDMDLSAKNVNPITMSTGTNKMQMAIQSAVLNRFAIRSTHTADYDNNPFIIYQPSSAGVQNDALVIQSNGVVTQPKKPAFHVRLNDAGASVQTPHTTHTVWENQGGHWNSTSHRFVAPVGGFYFFVMNGYTNYATGHGYMGIRKNGTQVHNGWHWNYTGGAHHGTNTMHAGLTLQTNDYVDFTRPSAGASSRFDILNASGFLIG